MVQGNRGIGSVLGLNSFAVFQSQVTVRNDAHENAVTSYRYGSPRRRGEGLRIGSARHLPRGVKRSDWQRGNYFDTWLPLVAPSADLVADFKCERIGFPTFARHYRTQMKSPEARHVIDLLAAVARSQPISVGCFCEDESRCHRSILRTLIVERLDTV